MLEKTLTIAVPNNITRSFSLERTLESAAAAVNGANEDQKGMLSPPER